MRVIGLTGGIASGKSLVAGILKQRGAEVIDADVIGHQIMEPGLPAYQEVVDFFGSEVLDSEGRINRKRLGEIVFSHPDKLKVLNNITHPRIFARIRDKIHLLRKTKGPDLVVVEAALLFEADLDDLVDEVWTVEADREVQVRRLIQRNGLTRQQALERIQSQLPPEERTAGADRVILNNASREYLVHQILAVLENSN